jgi:hypothetical protein
VPKANVYPLTSINPLLVLPLGFNTVQLTTNGQFELAYNGVKDPAGAVHVQTPGSVPLITTLPGHTIIGSSVSITSIKNLHVVELPAASVARYITIYNPTGNIVPCAGPAICVTVAPQLSSAIGTLHIADPSQSFGHKLIVNVTSVGQFTNTGASSSSTTTVIVQLVTLPAASTAVHVTTVVPTGKNAPSRLFGLPHAP